MTGSLLFSTIRICHRDWKLRNNFCAIRHSILQCVTNDKMNSQISTFWKNHLKRFLNLTPKSFHFLLFIFHKVNELQSTFSSIKVHVFTLTSRISYPSIPPSYLCNFESSSAFSFTKAHFPFLLHFPFFFCTQLKRLNSSAQKRTWTSASGSSSM